MGATTYWVVFFFTLWWYPRTVASDLFEYPSVVRLALGTKKSWIPLWEETAPNGASSSIYLFYLLVRLILYRGLRFVFLAKKTSKHTRLCCKMLTLYWSFIDMMTSSVRSHWLVAIGMVGARIKFSSWEVRNHTQNASQHHYLFISERNLNPRIRL